MNREVLLINNSRSLNHNPYSRYVGELSTLTVSGVDGMLSVTPEFIAAHGFEVIGIHGGDGTLGHLTDVITKAYQLSGELPHIVLTGGASAGTTLKELTRQGESTEIPAELEGMFPSSDFLARRYYPPKVIYDHTLDTQHIAYLFGADHLSINGTENVDALQNVRVLKNVPSKFTYTLAGIGTMANVLKSYARPTLLSYTQDENEVTVGSDMSPVLATIGVPRLGTFRFQDTIPHDKLWLLGIEGDEITARKKYLALALVGTMFQHGPDLAVKWGLVQRTEVTSATILPDQSPLTGAVNANLDGELRKVEGSVTVQRSTHGILFILPRSLTAA